MCLKLNVCGIDVQLKIRGYRPANRREDRDDQWCHCDVSFCSEDFLNYKIQEAEVFLSYEIEELESALTKLLNDELEKTEEFRCIEPDFIFNLHPKRDLRNDPKYLYVNPDYAIADIYVEWKIYFWNEGLTDNFLTVTLGRDEISALRDYLTSVINRKRTPKN